MSVPANAPHVPSAMRAAVDEVKARVAALHVELPRWELVVWSAGNVSERVRGAGGHDDLIVIKPSGVSYDELDSHARQQIAGYKVPRSIWLGDEISRLPSGKPDYRWAQQLVAEQAPTVEVQTTAGLGGSHAHGTV